MGLIEGGVSPVLKTNPSHDPGPITRYGIEIPDPKIHSPESIGPGMVYPATAPLTHWAQNGPNFGKGVFVSFVDPYVIESRK